MSHDERPIDNAADVAALIVSFDRLFGASHPIGPGHPAYFEDLLTDFWELDVKEELKRFHAWALDRGQTAVLNPHHRFRSWLHSARRFSNRYIK